jgi:hypothetical protein
MVNLEGIIWELSLDGLRHLEQAMLEEAPIEARNNPATYVLDFKPKQATVHSLVSFVERRPNLSAADRARIGHWLYKNNLECTLENLQAAVREVQSHADKEFVAEQLTSRRQIKPRADWD